MNNWSWKTVFEVENKGSRLEIDLHSDSITFTIYPWTDDPESVPDCFSVSLSGPESVYALIRSMEERASEVWRDRSENLECRYPLPPKEGETDYCIREDADHACQNKKPGNA